MNDFLNLLFEQFSLPLQNPVLIFAIILLIILFSPVLGKINIPGIIGLIISGIIIGPFGFNIIENNSAIELFSTIGLLYIMFQAGLDLNINEFRNYKYKSITFGFLTFMIPLSIGFPVCYYLLHFNIDTSFLTASMFATHTLVAYPIVSKMGINKNKAVAITVGGTIFTDTAVLIILAVIIKSHTGILDQVFWLRLAISLVIFAVIMFAVIPYLTKWFFRKWESEKQSHYIFVLAVLFLSAFLAEITGLEPIIGAFVAGLVLNPIIPHSSTLMNRIEFIGNALFIPFFLISVGMIVDLRVFLQGPTALIIALVLTAVAIFGKWLAAFFSQLLFRFTSNQRQLMFGLSSSHAAATLAIIMAGYRVGIIDLNILNGVIVLILITCIIASFATERAAKKIAISDAENLKNYDDYLLLNHEQILLPIYDFPRLNKLLDFSILIKDKKKPNPISLLSVVPNNEDSEQNILRSKKILDDFIQLASATEVNVKGMTTIDHNLMGGIARISREIIADIVVLSWPETSNIIDKSVNYKIRKFADSLEKCLFICDFPKMVSQSQRIVLITPPFAEREAFFDKWLVKVAKFSQELTAPILHIGSLDSFNAISKKLNTLRIALKIQHKEFDEWEDFLVLARNIDKEDILMVLTSRKGFVSYRSDFETIPEKLEKHFKLNNKVLIFPQQDKTHTVEVYEDISPETINKGIRTIGKIGKGIKEVFTKK